MYFVTEFFNHEIKHFKLFNFLGLYKQMGVFLLIVFSISELNLHLNDGLSYEFVDLLKDTIL